jgi:hypothetical protein
LHRHSSDISNLQAAENLRTGVRQGAIGAGRVVGWVISFIAGSGGVFALLELLK